MSSAAAASKIPVASHRRQSNGSSPERRTSPPAPLRQRKDSPSKITTTPKERPQSIDIEDEFNSKLQYGRLLASSQQSKPNGEVTSPSRIPVVTSRKLSSCSNDSTTSPAKSVADDEDADDAECLIKSDSPSKISKIPRRAGSPPKTAATGVPTFGWSLPTDRHELNQSSPTKGVPFSPLKPGSRKNSNGSNSSNDVQHQSSSESSESSESSSTQKSSNSTGSDSATEQLIATEDGPGPSRRRSKKNYEAFMMTGDRMICLAKTPANSEFISRTTNKRASGALEKVPFPEEDDPSAAVLRNPPVPRRDNLRTSTSEDQLANSALIATDLEDATGSVDTLLLEAVIVNPVPSKDVQQHRMPAVPHQKKSSSLHQQSSAESSPGKRPTTSPDFSTSSLISSEHYNGESLLDQDNLSPQSSSSPDTPEWSLVDSYHKQKNSEAKAPLLPIASEDDDENGDEDQTTTVLEEKQEQPSAKDEAIKSDGNRVIITIGTTNNNNDLNELSNSGEVAPMPSLNDSSEESDLESLRSYHPPARAIDLPSAERLAKRLYNLDGFKRTDVSRHLGKNNEFSQVVAEEYLRFFDFSGGISLDNALRIFLHQFCLTGETQERERVLLHFSRRYLECNPEFIANPVKQLFRSLDAVHTLTCAIMLLNTDLHGESVGLQRKMTCNEFIENLSELNDGQNFPRDLLRSIYYAVKETPIPWAPSEDLVIEDASVHQSAEVINKVVATLSDSMAVVRSSDENGVGNNFAIGHTAGGINPFLALPDPSTAVDYKKGYVMRKCCKDPNGKRTKMGKRSWRMFFVTLRDMVLYCFKDEKTIRQPGAFEDFSSAIRIHHGLAVRASDYSKKQFVFRLHTADRAEYLFQTSDEKELLTWIDAINYVVAAFSSPQLPAGCSSGSRFQRPLMPSAKSSLTMAAELESHVAQLQQYRREIEDHLQSPPPKNAKAAIWDNYNEKQEFLKFEIMRYETYILTLRTKNAHDT